MGGWLVINVTMLDTTTSSASSGCCSCTWTWWRVWAPAPESPPRSTSTTGITGGCCKLGSAVTMIIELVLIRVLEKLLESGALETVRELGLDMYNFYHRQGLGLSWARRGQ